MKINEIEEKPPIIFNKFLEEIFEMQTRLLDEYKKRGMAPTVFILNSHEGQNFLRSLNGYLLEEISEAYKEYYEMCNSFEDFDNREDLLKKLVAFNEELSDILHLFIEIFIYLKIEVDDIRIYYQNKLRELNLEEALYFPKNLLLTALGYAQHDNLQEGFSNQMRLAYKVNQTLDLPSYHRAGNQIAPDYIPLVREKLFLVMNSLLNINQNLKFKPWKENPSQSNPNIIRTISLDTFTQFMGFCVLMGASCESLYENYFLKNQINFKRLNGKS